MCLLDLLLLSLFSNTDKIGVALPVLPLLKTTTFFKILSCQMHKIKRIFRQDHKLLWCVRVKLVTVSQVYIENLLNYTKTGVKRVEKRISKRGSNFTILRQVLLREFRHRPEALT